MKLPEVLVLIQIVVLVLVLLVLVLVTSSSSSSSSGGGGGGGSVLAIDRGANGHRHANGSENGTDTGSWISEW